MEEIKKIIIAEKEYHIGGTSTVNWTETSNMDNFIVSGVYVCEDGIRINPKDNLPIANGGGAHNFSFVLQVAASNNVENPAVGQTLCLTNRYGGETKQYIRTYLLTGWTPWKEVNSTLVLGAGGMTDQATLDSTTEWGEYTGVLFDSRWMNPSEGMVLTNLYSALQAVSQANGASSHQALVTALNYLYNISGGDAGAFYSNLQGAMYKMSVYHNSSVLGGINSIFPNVGGDVLNVLKSYVKKRIVQKLDVIPFIPFTPEQSIVYGFEPQTITRFGDVKDDGSVHWSPFFDQSGKEGLLQINPTRLHK
jgi:hypothetical protein